MKKKRLLAALMAGIMLVSTGCGASSNGGGSSSDGGDSGEITITIPSYKTGENVGAAFFEPQVERFNEAYEGQYQIELENVTEDVFNDQMKQLAQQNELPPLVQGGDKEWLRTVVFPNADLKIYLDADPKVRAKRRQLQNEENNIVSTYEEVLKQIIERDNNDKNKI